VLQCVTVCCSVLQRVAVTHMNECHKVLVRHHMKMYHISRINT